MSEPVEKRCANGMNGCDLESGQLYVVRHPCQNQRVLGHIFCDQCREGAGGYPKRKAILAAAGKTA